MCRTLRHQLRHIYDLVLQDTDFSITNMHRAHAAVGRFRELVVMSDGNIIIWTTGCKYHSFVNFTVSPGQFNYSEKINKERNSAIARPPNIVPCPSCRREDDFVTKTEQKDLQWYSGCSS